MQSEIDEQNSIGTTEIVVPNSNSQRTMGFTKVERNTQYWKDPYLEIQWRTRNYGDDEVRDTLQRKLKNGLTESLAKKSWKE